MLTQDIPSSRSPSARPKTPALSEFVCGPCSFSRIYSRGTFYCPVCKELFCHNCAKLHRMKEWSQNHAIVLLDKANSKQLKAIASQKISKSERELPQRPQRWGRRAPLNEGFESKSKYLNALASNHDHEVEDLENELYCPEHDVIFCLRCKNPHTDCKGTVSIDSLAKKIDIAQVISNYKRCVKFADIMLEDRLEQKKQVESQRSEIIPNIQSMKSEFGNIISKKASVIENEVSTKIEQNIKKIHQHMEKCKRVKYMAQSDIDSLLSAVEKAVPGTIVKVYLRLKVKYLVYEKYLRELYNDTEYVSYQFVPNEEIMILPNIISSIGTLKETRGSSKLPPFMSVDNVKPFKERSLSNRKNGDIRLFGLGVLGKGGITSMRCTDSYIMAVARSTCEFRVFTLRGWTFAHLTLSSLPWDFTLISEKEAIVSLPGDKKLVTLTIDFTLRKITQTREIILDEACWGLTEFKGKLIGTFLPFESDTHLRVMTYDGITERKIEIQDSPVAFRAPQYVLYHEDKVYISDSFSHALIIIDLDGQVTFAFKAAEFENPAGMTVDDQGNVYVCGKTSHNVFQISREGDVREILSQEDCPSRPCCIGLLGDGSTLLVGYSNSNVLKSFQFR